MHSTFQEPLGYLNGLVTKVRDRIPFLRLGLRSSAQKDPVHFSGSLRAS